MLDARVRGCTAEILINDVPFVFLGEGKGNHVNAPVNETLIAGINELTLVINPPRLPSLIRQQVDYLFDLDPSFFQSLKNLKFSLALQKAFAQRGIDLPPDTEVALSPPPDKYSDREFESEWELRSPQIQTRDQPQISRRIRLENGNLKVYEQRVLKAQGASASACLFQYPAGTALNSGKREELIRVEWNGSEDDQPQNFSQSVSNSCNLQHVSWPCPWESAKRVDLDLKAREQIEELLKTLRKAFLRKRFDPVLDLVKPRLRQVEQAYGLPEEDRQKVLSNILQELSSEPDWDMEPLKEDQWDLRVCGGGRLVECLTKDRKPILCATPDNTGGRFTFPAFLGKIGGEWKILR